MCEPGPCTSRPALGERCDPHLDGHCAGGLTCIERVGGPLCAKVCAGTTECVTLVNGADLFCLVKDGADDGFCEAKRTAGESCSGALPCSSFLSCLDLDADGEGTCRLGCSGNGDCGASEVCRKVDDSEPGICTLRPVLGEACDPHLDGHCVGGLTCIEREGEPVCAKVCAGTTECATLVNGADLFCVVEDGAEDGFCEAKRTAGESCSGALPCSSFLSCLDLDADGEGTCRQGCSRDSDCGSSEACGDVDDSGYCFPRADPSACDPSGVGNRCADARVCLGRPGEPTGACLESCSLTHNYGILVPSPASLHGSSSAWAGCWTPSLDGTQYVSGVCIDRDPPAGPSVCIPLVEDGGECDPTGFENTCGERSRCISGGSGMGVCRRLGTCETPYDLNTLGATATPGYFRVASSSEGAGRTAESLLCTSSRTGYAEDEVYAFVVHERAHVVARLIPPSYEDVAEGDRVLFARTGCEQPETELQCSDESWAPVEMIDLGTQEAGTVLSLFVDGRSFRDVDTAGGAYQLEVSYLPLKEPGAECQPYELCPDDYTCSAVTKVCVAGECGDGAVSTGEDCDDGNLVSGDGCSATCLDEAGAEVEPNDETQPQDLGEARFIEGSLLATVGDFIDYEEDHYVFDLPAEGPHRFDVVVTHRFAEDELRVKVWGWDCLRLERAGEVVLRCDGLQGEGGEQVPIMVDSPDYSIGFSDPIDYRIEIRATPLSSRAQGEPCDSFGWDDRCTNGFVCVPHSAGLSIGSCETPRCGDRVRTGAEQCDDGGTLSGDGCDAACQFEVFPEVEPDNDSEASAPVFREPLGRVRGTLMPRYDTDYFGIEVQTASLLYVSYSDGAHGCPANVLPGLSILARGSYLESVGAFPHWDARGDETCLALRDEATGGPIRLEPGTYYVSFLGWGRNDSTTSVYYISYELVPDVRRGLNQSCKQGASAVGCAASYTCDPDLALCVVPTCGDGVVQGAEECDDGNLIQGDGCSETCAWEPVAEVEPNDTRSHAIELPASGFVKGRFSEEDSAESSDADWYRVEIEVASRFVAALDRDCPESSSSKGNFRLSLLRRDGQSLIHSVRRYYNCSDPAPVLEAGTLPAGTYYLRVQAESPGPYTLTTKVEPWRAQPPF